MTPHRTVTTNDRVRIITLREEGLSIRDVARRLHRSQSDVVWTWNRFQLTGSVEDVHRTSCPHSTGAQDDRYLCLLSRKNSGLSAPGLNSVFDEATGRCVSHQTLRRRLHDANPHSWRPWWEPRRTPQHHGLRYWWARNHVEWTPQDIGCFLFFSLIPIRQHVPLHFVILHVLVYFNTGWSAYYFIMFYFVIWW